MVKSYSYFEFSLHPQSMNPSTVDFKSSSYFEFSLHPQLISPLTVDCQIFLLFRIFLAPTNDQSFDSWLSNFPLISNFLCTHNRSILWQLIVNSSSVFEFSLHPQSINPSSGFEFSLHSRIDSSHPPQINYQSTWSSSVKIIPLVSIFLSTPHR